MVLVYIIIIVMVIVNGYSIELCFRIELSIGNVCIYFYCIEFGFSLYNYYSYGAWLKDMVICKYMYVLWYI